MISLTLENVDGFVRKQQRKGVNVRTDGWTIVFFRPDRRAERRADGRFDRATGKWGFEVRIDANSKGNWLVNPSLTKGNKSAGK